MGQTVKLRRSAVGGKKPLNSQLELGELSVNTTDGKLYFAKSGSQGPSVEEIITTNAKNTGSLDIVGSITASNFTGSFTGDGSGLYNISVSGVTGLSLDKLTYGSSTASIDDRGLHVNVDTSITGSLTATEFTGSGLGLTNVPFRLSGSSAELTAYDDQYTKIHFDDSTGIKIEGDSTTGIARIYLDGVAAEGGSGEGSTALLSVTGATSTWTFNHNLGEKYPAITVFDSNNNVIIPQNIEAVSTTQLVVSFASPQTGYVTATVGGGLPTISSSYGGRFLTVNSGGTAPEWSEVDFLTNGSFNTYTSSIGLRVGSLETESGSIRDDFNTITSSFDDRLRLLEGESGSIRVDFNSYTSSNNTLNNSQNGRLNSLETESGSIRTFFNAYTASNNTTNTVQNNRLSALETKSGSLDSDISTIEGRLDSIETESGSIRGTFNSYTSSNNTRNSQQDGRLDSIESFTASIDDTYATDSDVSDLRGDFNTYTSSNNTTNSTQNGRLNSLETESGSIRSVFNTYTSSNNTTNTTQNNRLTSLETKTGSLDSDISTIEGRLDSIETTTSSLDGRVDSLETESASIRTTFNSYTSSNNTTNTTQNNRLTSLETTTASFDGRLDSLETTSASHDGRLDTIEGGLEFTGSNVTVKGNLLVKGTETRVNSTTVEISDNIISLNGSGAANGGIEVRDTTSPGLLSGSLLWDSTNNYWIGGTKGSEERLLDRRDLTSLSGDISTLDGRVDSLETESGSIRTAFNTYTSSNNTTNTTQNNRLTSLETKTGSLDDDISTIDGRLDSIETESGSIRTTFNSYTSSNNTTNTTQNSRLTSLESKTGSYLTSYTETQTLEDVATLGNATTLDLEARSFIVTGANGSQFLKGDGSLDGNTYLTAHPSVSAATSSNNSGRTYIQDILLDSFGHITGITTATETVVNTDTNNFTTGATFNTSDGVVTFTRNNGNTYTVDLDGRYLQSYTETDPIFTASDAFNIRTADITNWNTAFGWGDHSTIGYLTEHPSVSAATSSNNSGRTYIQDILLDSFGHITGITTASETVVDTYITGATFNTTSGVITFTKNNGGTVTVDIDGKYAESGHNHDADYVNVNGDTMTGNLKVRGNINIEDGDLIMDSGTVNGTNYRKIRFTEDIDSAAGFQGAYMHYNADDNLFQIGTHNASDTNVLNDVYHISMTRGTGDVTINNNITASSFIKRNGTSSQFLMADGSVSTNPGWITAHPSVSAATSSNNSGRTYIQDILLDSFGHITGITTATETVVDTNNFTTGATFNNTNGVVTFTRNNGATYTVDLDGRYLQSYTETQTLEDVVTLGGTTTLDIEARSFIVTGANGSQFLKGDGTLDSNTYLTAHPSVLAANSSNNSGRTYIQDILLDGFGHITGITTATETVVNTDTNYYTTGTTWNGTTATLTFTRNDGGTYSVQMLETLTDVTVTGGTYNSGTQTLRLTKSDGTSIDVSGFAVDTDVNWYVTGLTFNTSTGVLTATRNDGGATTVDLDGRYLQSYTETDTLDSVADRGNTTDQTLTMGGLVISGASATATSLIFSENGTNILGFRYGGNLSGNPLDIYNFQSNALLMRMLEGGATTFTNSVTSTSFIKSGGTSTQFLKADGSVDGNTYLTAHPSVSAASSSNNSGRTYIQDILLDSFGHITGITTATETVVNTDTITRVGVSGSEVTGTVTLVGSGATTVNQVGQIITVSSTNTTYTAGGGLTLTGTEFAHADTSSQASSNNSGRTYIQDILLDGYGHITGITTATETVVNTDTNYYTTGATFNTSDGVITFTRNNGGTYTVDIDGRYLTSYTETDTLASVTARGATTTTNITTGLQTIYKQTDTTGTNGTTFITLDNYVGGDISQQQTFIDFKFTDTNANFTPQVRIGAQVGPDADANAISREGAGSFVVYTAPIGSDESGGSTGLVEQFRVSYNGTVTAQGQIVATGGNSTQWNTAYGWGNHASAGYLTSYTDTNNYVTGATFNTGNGIITLTKNDGTTVTVDIDGRFLTSYTETDTLDSVVARGNTTARGITLGSGTPWTPLVINASAGEGTANAGVAIALDGESYAEYGYRFKANGANYYQVLYDGSSINWKHYNSGYQTKMSLSNGGNLTLTGTLTASGYNDSNWNTAYGWGNHASAGYLTAVPSSFSTNSITIGNAVTLSESTDRADLLSINSGTSGWGGLQITNTAGEGILSLMIDGSNGGLYDDQNGDWLLYYTENGSVELRYNSLTRLVTQSDGVDISGNLDVTGTLIAGNTFVNGLITGGFGSQTTDGTLDWNDSSNARSGQGYSLLLGNHSNGPTSTGQYFHPFSFEYSSKNGGGNLTQLAIPYTGYGLHYRSRYDNTWDGWISIWDTSHFSLTNISNWNTAYGWGNHASAGYLTSYTDTNNYVTGATFNTGNGVITLTKNDGTTVTVDIDGRFLTSYTETDTLASVTARGASTSTDITVQNVLINDGSAQGGTGIYDTYKRLTFSNAHSDVARGPNKITMYDNGSAWMGGFGIHSGTVAYYSGDTHKWYKTVSRTSFTEVMSLSNAGNLTLTGTLTASGYNKTNWDTAYGWGNHASAGYLTSYTDYYTTGATFNSGTGIVTFTRNNGATYTLNIAATLTDVTVTGGTYNSGTQTLRLTKSDGNTVDVSGFAIDTDVNWYTTGATFNTGDGIITGTHQGGTWTVDIDGRYLELGGGILTGNIGRSAHNNGFLVGGYNNIGASASATNPIFTIGTAYLPAVTTLGNMYGIGYTRADASFMGIASGTGWGMYVAADGDARIWLDGSSGNIVASGTLSASGYNDSNWNTAYTYSQVGHLPLAGGTLTGDLQVNGHIRGGGQQLILNAGESSSYATGQTSEIVYINAEAGLEILSSPDNWSSGWAGRNSAYINRADATSYLPGTLTVNGHGNSSQWNTAYGWGNHASVGYLTSYTETDTLATVTSRGSTMSAVLYSTRNTASGLTNLGFSTAKTIIGNIHIQNGGGSTNNNSNQAAITFQGDSTSQSQAGIYVLNNNSYGTSMGFAVTENYTTGPQLFMTATNNGVVNFTRQRPTVGGSGIWHAGDFTSTNISNWNTAYGWGDHNTAGYVTGATYNSSGDIITFTKNDGTTFEIDIVDNNTNYYVTGGAFDSSTGVITISGNNAVVTATIDISGVNADLLDGQHGSYYAQASLSNNKTYTSTGNVAGSYLGGHYSSGGNEKPNSGTFGSGKLKHAMLSGTNLGFGGSWNDVLWISSYNGGDVKSSHALVFDKYSTNVYVSDQNYDSASWGTGYQLWHTDHFSSTNISNWDTAYGWGNHAGLYLGINSKAADSNLLDGLDLHTGRNNEANKVVRTDGNGYLNVGWINTTSGDRGTTAPTRIYASNDDYIRYYTPANFISVLGLITTSSIGSQSVSYASSAGYASEAKWINFDDGPRDLSDRRPNWNNRSVAWDFVTAGTVGGSGNYAGVMTFSPWDGTAASTGDSSYQLAFANITGVNASGIPGLRLRNGIDTTWNSWYTIWHSGNDGAGSGLDSDYLDGQQGSYYTDAGNLTGTIGDVFSAGTRYNIGLIDGSSSQTRDKIRVWTSAAYSIGMKDNYTYGHLANDYAMSFQMSNTTGRGFWWGDEGHSDAQGAMSLTTDGKATIATSLSIGQGETVTSPSTATLYVESTTAGSKVFEVQGTAGQLFSITDDLSGELFAVSDVSGIPILSVTEDGTVTVDDTLHVMGDVIAYYSSDSRLKENIVNIQNPLDKIKMIGGYEFDWNENSKNQGHDVGVIAQEIEKVLPELVSTRNDGYKGVKYDKLTALLIEANKELLKRVEELESKLNKK